MQSKPMMHSYPLSQLLIKAKHLRSDASRPGDLYAIARGTHAKDTTIDVIIVSSMSKSRLVHSSKSSDCVLRRTEDTQFNKDLRNREPRH